MEIFTANSNAFSFYLLPGKASSDRDILKQRMFQHAFANPKSDVIFSAPYNSLTSHGAKNREKWISVVAPIRKDDTLLAGLFSYISAHFLFLVLCYLLHKCYMKIFSARTMTFLVLI